jgi:hypothetical protein
MTHPTVTDGAQAAGRATLTIQRHATIEPWVDPVLDAHGHDPRGEYVERFWLGIVGPTATWILRRLADGFDDAPHGYVIDLEHTACAMGLSFTKGPSSPFGKALHRCVMFGLATPTPDGLAVRRRLPQVAQRHLTKLPEDLQAQHLAWARATVRLDRSELERRLREAGLPSRVAVRATEAALRVA